MEGDNEVFIDLTNESRHIHHGLLKASYNNRRKRNLCQNIVQPLTHKQGVNPNRCLSPGWVDDQFQNSDHVRDLMQEINNCATDLGHLTAEEVDSILSFVAQDGKLDKSDQQVPNITEMKATKTEKNKPKRQRLTYAQKCRRLQNPVDFEAEFRASLNDALKKTKRRKVRPRVSRAAAGITNDLIFAMEKQGVVSPGLDLAVAMGIPDDELTKDRTAVRRHSIRAKLKRPRTVQFSLAEEYDIHTRAENHACKLTPDRDYCYLQWECNPEEEFAVPESQPERHRSARNGPKRKRKRKSRTGDFYVVQPFGRMHVEPDDEIVLPQGLCLVRPPNKLVELVAQAINSSPDGLLQVQQVYHVLQNKYPYYRYMDKSSLTSWRSSIRHALYQKWFRKVCFQSEFINCRGCYWAINRKHQPREWTLPAVSQFQSQTLQELEEETISDGLHPFIATAVQSNNNNSVMEALQGNQETSTDAGGDVVSLPAAAATSMHPLTIRDPDPMFPPQIFPLVRPAQLNSAQDPLLATMEFPATQTVSSEVFGGSEGSSDKACSDFSDGSGVDAPQGVDAPWEAWWEESMQRTYSVSSPTPMTLPSFSLTLPGAGQGTDVTTMDINVHWSPLKLQDSENLLLESPQRNIPQEDLIML